MRKSFSPGHKILILVVSLTFISCGHYRKIQRLDKLTVKDIFVVYDTTTLNIPGSTLKIGIGVNAKVKGPIDQQRDTLLFTRGFREGSLSWSNFNIKTFGCSYSNGKIKIYDQEWPEKGNIAIDAEVISQPEKHFYLTIPRNYITETRLIPLNSFHKAPGNIIRLGIKTTYDNSAVEVIWKKNEVSRFLSKCNIFVTGGDYYDGEFLISDDINRIEYDNVGIITEPVNDPSLIDTLSIQLDYIEKYVINLSAGGWGNGMPGGDGYCGGTSGHDGENGSDGGNGENGYDGDYGHDVSVFFDAFYDTILKADLCYASVEDLNGNYKMDYLVNPNGGSIVLYAHGGDGGNGGDGGDGGCGGPGENGATYTMERTKSITVTDSTGTHTVDIVETYTVTEPGGNGGNGGYGGYGGYGGDGGNGGNVFVYYTDAGYPYLDCLRIKNYGGTGGFGGSGGSAGSGGSGGSGNPSGRSGSPGNSGSSGRSGSSGWRGEIRFIKYQPE